MDLHATRSLGRIVRSHFIQPENFSRGIIELIMIDFESRKCGVEGELYVRRPRRKLEACHFFARVGLKSDRKVVEKKDRERERARFCAV